MPIYEYEAVSEAQSCPHCIHGFELLQKMSDTQLTQCPQCQAPVKKMISTCSVGGSSSSFDDRAKSAGFSKLKKIGKGEYEKQY